MTASFYKAVYQRKLNELPSWKKLAVMEDSERNNWSGILTDFVKSVIEEAEKEYANSKTTISDNQSKCVSDSEKTKKKVVKKS